ncbi:MAG: CidA/LrgA family protein [Spirochaetales bacterium]|nr:CidA/LrgA family protein [Spirochaetales bacterium]
MKYFRQLIIILGAYFLGMLLEYTLKLPIPGVVLGLVLLFLALQTGLIKEEWVEGTADFLLTHMAFLFLPAGVGLMTSAGVLKGNVLPFTVIIILTTAVVWTVTAFTVKALRKLFK